MLERPGRWLPGRLRDDPATAAAVAASVAPHLAEFITSLAAATPDAPRSLRQERVDEAYDVLLTTIETAHQGLFWTPRGSRRPRDGRSSLTADLLAADRSISGSALTSLAARLLSAKATPGPLPPAAELARHWSSLLEGHGRDCPRPFEPHTYRPATPAEDLFDDFSVRLLLARLPTGKAVGPDRLPAELLRAAPTHHALWVQALFRWLWAEGLVPSAWRESFLHPIYKGSGPTDRGASYRGLSLMSHLRKAFESALAPALERVVGPRCDAQHGFTDGRSIWGPVWALHTELRADAAAGRSPHVLFVDIEKAYDTVDRTLLWSKLADRGARGTRILDLLRELSDDNVQLIRSADGVGAVIPCERGLPQGSALSPVLYTYFIDDLPASLGLRPGASCRAYADDVAVRTSGTDPAELQLYCDRLVAYAAFHGFRVSTAKTELLADRPVHLGRVPVLPVPACRYLGVRFTIAGVDLDSTHRGVAAVARRALDDLVGRGLMADRVGAHRRLHLAKAFVFSRLDFASGLPAPAGAALHCRRLYEHAASVALFGRAPDDTSPHRPAPHPELLAAAGLFPWLVHRGRAAWTLANQAAWAGVPWRDCAPLLLGVPFLNGPPDPPPPPSLGGRAHARAAIRVVVND